MRWKLRQAHYLSVPGQVWEYSELDRVTGRPKRTQFPVPRLIDPMDPADWTEKVISNQGKVVDGFCIVCYEGKGQPTDVVFTGPPTPDMEPMDDEATALSATFASKWKHPIESLPSGGYAQVLQTQFEGELAKVQANNNKPAQIEGMTELLTAMTSMMKQNQEMMAALMATKSESVARRA